MKPELHPGIASLPEVHGSVSTKAPTLWRRMFAFAGPAYLVSVGYMDPGNWATDLEGGARFGYQLLWVLLLSNLMAILLQTLSARLGIVSGRDLAQTCREAYPKSVSMILWVLCEIAIAACDLAEVLGAAIGLKLLFGIPLLWGVLLTVLDTFLVLWLTRYGIRLVEALILVLVLTVAGCFLVELAFAKPNVSEMVLGLVPRLTDQSLYVAIGILGATVMPHNLYLHSGIVQTRAYGTSLPEKKSALRFATFDSTFALCFALLINASILILAAATFNKSGNTSVAEIGDAHKMLAPLVGSLLAPKLFAIALLCCGLNSTVTATLAGQIVMEGFLNIRLPAWMRRLITRAIAIVPAAAVTIYYGASGTGFLLIFSQVILAFQLPFAIVPLVLFTADSGKMGAMVSPKWLTVLAGLIALLIIALNVKLLWDILL